MTSGLEMNSGFSYQPVLPSTSIWLFPSRPAQSLMDLCRSPGYLTCRAREFFQTRLLTPPDFPSNSWSGLSSDRQRPVSL